MAEKETKKKYRVKPGNTITVNEPDADGKAKLRVIEAGEEVSLTEEQAAGAPHALEVAERRRSRNDGQLTRAEKEIARLKAEIETLKQGPKDPREDPEYDNAVASLRKRGDNFMARGEPEIGKVPPSVIDDHDRAIARAESGKSLEDLPSDDELAGGMKGLARGTVSQEAVNVTGPQTSDPAEPAQGGPGVEDREPKSGKPAKPGK